MIRRGAASPVSTRRSRSLSFFFTRSAETTIPTRRSSFAKSPNSIGGFGFGQGCGLLLGRRGGGRRGALLRGRGRGREAGDELLLLLLLEAREDRRALRQRPTVQGATERELPEILLRHRGQRLEAELPADAIRDRRHHRRDHHAHRFEHLEQRDDDGPEARRIALLRRPRRGLVDVHVGRARSPPRWPRAPAWGRARRTPRRPLRRPPGAPRGARPRAACRPPLRSRARRTGARGSTDCRARCRDPTE